MKRGVVILSFLFLLAPGLAPEGQKALASDDDLLLSQLGIPADGKGLLAYFEQRKIGAGSPREVEKQALPLIDLLGDDDPVAARQAAGKLAGLGAPVIPLLRQAARELDQPQKVALARDCLNVLENQPGQLTAACVRLLGQRRPKGTVAALVDFLPSAEDSDVLDTIRDTLGLLARVEGKADPALLAALHDPVPLRRAQAINALCQQGQAEPRAVLIRLLEDPMPSVRLRAALALTQARDPAAPPTLIRLLTELSLAPAQEAEQGLRELAGDSAPTDVLASDAGSAESCRAAWEAWWKKRDDRFLIEEVRRRTLTEQTRQRTEQLIKQLESDEFEAREQAQKDLTAMGVMVLPLLRAALESPDVEVRRRLRVCIRTMEHDTTLPLPQSVPRLLAMRRPEGAVEVLLDYLPFADSADIRQDVQQALNVLAVQHGKVHPALVRALQAAIPARQAAAAEAICLSSGPGEYLPAMRKLLESSNLLVRQQVALALAGSGYREAAPVLIHLIGELSRDEASPIADYLNRLAQEKEPANVASGDSPEDRARSRDAWAAWWQKYGEQTPLVPRYGALRQSSYLGYTLLALNTNEVIEIDRKGKERWRISNLRTPQDAQVVGSNRVLVAELQGQCVTERTLRGAVVWQHATPGSWPLQAQRLRNGRTFIVCANRLLEVDRGGREVVSIPWPQGDIMAAHKLRNGEIVALVNSQRACLRLDATGREIRRFPIQILHNHGVEIGDNGGVTVPVQWMNKVQEYDPTGKIVLEATLMQPTAVCHTAKGHLLVSSTQGVCRLVELDRKGQQVGSELYNGAHVLRMHHR